MTVSACLLAQECSRSLAMHLVLPGSILSIMDDYTHHVRPPLHVYACILGDLLVLCGFVVLYIPVYGVICSSAANLWQCL